MTDVIEKMEKISNHEEKSERKPMSAVENLRNIQKRMAKQLERPATKNAVPSWDKINEDLKGFQQVRALLWDAFEGISPTMRTEIQEVLDVYLDECVEKGKKLS